MPKSRIFLWLLLAFVSGVALRSFFEVYFGLLVLGVAAAGVFLVWAFQNKNRHFFVYAFISLVFIAGVFRYSIAENYKPDIDRFLGDSNTFTGFVADEPEKTIRLQRIKMKVEKANQAGLSDTFYVLISSRLYPEYEMGDELMVDGILKQPANFSDFNYVEFLAKESIYATMDFPSIKKIGSGRGSWLKLVLYKIKLAFEEKIDRALPEPHAAFLKGLTIGEREALPERLVEDFNRTGTTHIVALSGYNITLVSRFLMAVLIFLTLPFQVAFWFAISGVALFVMLTGASASVVRAGIMGILVLIAEREGRIYSITNALVFAGATMVFHNPKILRFDAAFQLSFLATIGIVYLAPRIEEFYSRLKKERVAFEEQKTGVRPGQQGAFGPLSLRKVFIETISAQLMVLPLLIYLFGRVSLISPVVNILVLLAVPYSMAAGFMTAGAGFFSETLAGVISWPAWLLLEYKIKVIETFALLPFASLELGGWVVLPLLVMYGVIFWKITKKT